MTVLIGKIFAYALVEFVYQQRVGALVSLYHKHRKHNNDIT